MGEKPKPFKTEYAKSGRAACKGCKEKINKDELRIATVTEAAQFDGYMTSWFHPDCFMKRPGKIKTVDDIDGLDALRWEDQQKFREYVEGGGGGAGGAKKGGAKGAAKKAAVAKEEAEAEGEFLLEYAKSSRSTCRGCDEKILKDEVRIACMEESTDPRFRGLVPQWHHAKCFLDTGLWLGPLSKLPGWSTLEDSEKQQMEDLKAGRTTEAPKKKQEEKPAKKKRGKAAKAEAEAEGEEGPDEEAPAPKKRKQKAKAEPEEEAEAAPAKKRGRSKKAAADEATEEEPKPKEARLRGGKAAAAAAGKAKEHVGKIDPELEKGLEKQSRNLWAIKDNLRRHVSTSELRDILAANQQCSAGSEQELRDRCADGMVFGPLDKCPLCKGYMEYHDGKYRCRGFLSAWSKCTYNTRDAPRLAKTWALPEENDNEYLDEWAAKQAKPNDRAHRLLPPASDKPSPKKAEPSKAKEEERAAAAPDKPLAGMVFVCAGKLAKPQKEIRDLIKEGGGKLELTVGPGTTALVAAAGSLEEESRKVLKAREQKVPIVREEFLYESVEKQARLNLRDYLIEDTAVAVVKVKGRGAVHPDSGFQDKGHILEKGKSVYNTTMNLSDSSTGVNSFYILQIIEEDKRPVCHLFRKWGRIGTTRGGQMAAQLPRGEAISEFERLFLEKSGSSWQDWEAKTHVKCPGKFYPIEIDYGEDEGPATAGPSVTPGSRSKLEGRVVDLMKMLFDIETYRATMLEFEINLAQMPLGKLKKSHVEQGFKVLSQIQRLLDSGGEAQAHLLTDASNQFFTLIPTVNPAPISDEKMLKEKIRMLEALRDIEIASKLMNDMSGQSEGEDPVDVHFRQLKCGVKALPKDGPEFALAVKYLQKTHAPTHTEFALEVEDVFEVEREGEAEAYAPFKESLHNRKLLWHGSRTSNYVGILSQGLRIAPPEAPVTGYMFGKGLYFADMASKSAQYCYTSKGNPMGLMLLCEVALGETYELRKAQYMEKPPRGKHSTKGLGKTMPDPAEFEKLPEDVEVPCGNPTKSNVRGSDLLYNEYIVYDPSQVKLRYLLKVRFKHKR